MAAPGKTIKSQSSTSPSPRTNKDLMPKSDRGRANETLRKNVELLKSWCGGFGADRYETEKAQRLLATLTYLSGFFGEHMEGMVGAFNIYTDWANHYLEKCQKRRLILDLQKDMQDSLLLIDVVESVTGEKVPDIKQKPKNPAQVVENIGSCLRFVESLGVNVEGLTAKDIRDGQLKSILGLFFSLSRYKQQQKSLASTAAASPKHQIIPCASPQKVPQVASNIPTPAQMSSANDSLSRLPSPFKSAQNSGTNNSVSATNNGNSPGGSGIPCPQTPTKNANTTKSQLPTVSEPQQQSKIKGPAVSKLNGSKRDLASSQSELRKPKPAGSGIPAPGAKGKSGLKPPSRIQSPASSVKSAGSTNNVTSTTTPTAVGNQGKMLEKFKLFGSKDKTSGQNSPRSSLPKSSTRASNSSSGFSSAKSETSESVVGTQSLGKQGTAMTNSGGKDSVKDISSTGISSPKAALKSLTKKGMKSPKFSKSAWKSGKDEKPALEKTSGSAQTSPQLLRKRTSPAGALAPVGGEKKEARLSKGSEKSDTDVDSAYAGFDSSSPCSSNGPPDSKLYLPSTTRKSPPGEERKPPIGAPSEEKTLSPTSQGGRVVKPTMAVKGITAGSKPAPGTAKTTAQSGLVKPTSLPTTAKNTGIKHSASNSEKLNQLQKSTARSYSSIGLKQPSTVSKALVGAAATKAAVAPASSPTVGIVSPMTHHKPQAKLEQVNRKSPPPALEVQSDSSSSQGRDSDSVSVIFNPDAGSDRPISRSSSASSSKPAVPKKPSTDKLKDAAREHERTSLSPAPRTSSRVETTFDSSDGVVTTETLPEEIPEEAGPVRKDTNSSGSAGSMEGEDLVQPMEPLVPRSSPYAYLKGVGGSSGKGSQLRLVPDPSVSAGKKPHLTLNRPIQGSTLLNSASSEESMDPGSGIRSAAGEVSAGYVSEGDAALAVTGLSGPLAELSSADLASGYMSEGGISLYARKMQAKLREGIEQCVRDSIRRHDAMTDSFEDSSSLSSGLSENIDEISTDDLTGSSLSDHQVAYHNSVVNQQGLRRITHGNQKLTPAQQKLVQQEQKKQSLIAGGKGKKAESAQQTEKVAQNNLQQRKLSEQESIDQLLQKCRTSARGLGVSAGTRPKSAQMNGGTVFAPREPAYGSHTLSGPSSAEIKRQFQQHRVQLSADGQVLRVTPGGYGASSHRGKTPLTGNTMKLLKGETELTESQTTAIPRPGSAQAGSVFSPRGPGFSGYHSLDRKRHLMGYYSERDDLLEELNGQQPRSGNYANHVSALSALVSPRRYPVANGSLSLPVSHEGPFLPGEEDIAATWTRHTAPGGPNTGRKYNNSGELVMSRSMIERRELKVSPQDHQPENHKNFPPSGQEKRGNLNGHVSRISSQKNSDALLRNQHKQNGVGGIPLPGPRMARSSQSSHGRNGSQSEGVYANLIQRTSSTGSGQDVDVLISPTSQMYLHKISGEESPSAHSAPVGKMPNYPNGGNPYLASVLGKVGPDEEGRGSSLSLASASSSIYSTAEERYQAEIRKLHREVDAYRDKVKTLTAQQTTYSSMMQAFEKALQGMVKRVEALQSASQQKDDEVTDLRDKINVIREMSLSAGINVDHVIRAASPAIQRRHTFNSEQQNECAVGLVRQPSCESMVSTVSQKSSVSTSSKGSKSDRVSMGSAGGKAKKGWIRSSFSRAFSKNRKQKNESMSDVDEHPVSECGVSNPCSPLHSARSAQGLKGASSSSDLNTVEAVTLVNSLKEKLADKDKTLTEFRLEHLTTAQQVDQLKETLNKLKNENQSLKHNNERLNRMVKDSSRNGSQNSLPLMSDGEESVSEYGAQTMSDVCHSTNSFSGESARDRDLRKLMVSVRLTLSGEMDESANSEMLIGQLAIGARTSWDRLDSDLGKIFNEYLHKVDPVGNLNLNSLESLTGYKIGETCRNRSGSAPKHLPAKCTEQSHSLQLVLKGVKQNAVDALAFETLIPKSNLQRFVHQLQEQKRLILCGSCGTGKTYLARKLAEYLVLSSGRKLTSESIDTVKLEESSRKGTTAESLKKYLGEMMKRWGDKEKVEERVPVVVVLDNLHHISAFSDVFSVMNSNGGEWGKGPKGPFIIGTMNQSTPITSLQIQHNFRFVLLANHMEPVKGFLGRYLRRRLIQEECRRGFRCSQEMVRVLEWLPKVWAHLNKFLEVANSPDVTIGPRLFLSCPLMLEESREWFVDLWNRNIQPYLVQAAREGLQMYGKGRSSLEDPCEFICDEWPWTEGDVPDAVLARITPDDLSISSDGVENTAKVDPLMMLVRLREQAGQPTQEMLMPESAI